jgi:excisionase family DNA binding protein
VRIQADLLDHAVSNRVLEILRPEQVEIALRAVKELERRGQAVDQQWRMRVERLEYQAQLAQRRYEEVDPSNRLVAGTLERRWNDALVELNAAQEELHRSRQQQGLELTEEQKTQMRALAEDLPKLWKSQTTAAADRKRMLRLLLQDITVEKRRAQRKAILHLRWQGGVVEDLSINLPLPVPDKVRYPEALVNRIRSLAATMTDTQIAAILNREGLLSAKGKRFTRTIVSWTRYRYDIPPPSLKSPDELTVGEVADRFGVSPGVVYYWIQRGHLPSRRLQVGNPYWISLSAENEAELREWVANSHRIKPSQTQNPLVSCAV